MLNITQFTINANTLDTEPQFVVQMQDAHGETYAVTQTDQLPMLQSWLERFVNSFLELVKSQQSEQLTWNSVTGKTYMRKVIGQIELKRMAQDHLQNYPAFEFTNV